MGMRAAIYCRISQDRGGAGLGVARQEDDCRQLCERRGWDVAAVYTDNDVSAYSGAPRPEWARLLRDVQNGHVDAIASWHVDRLTRSPRELEDIIDLADRQGIELATVSGEIDLATPTGRMVARMLGAAARHEAEHKAERQKRQRRQAAEAGKVSGGGMRPFGYEDDRVTIREDEALVLREVARRALARESLSSIVRDLKARDVRTATGGYFVVTTLRDILISARISGRREHRPRSAGESRGKGQLGEIVATAVWPGIISAEDSDKLRTLLTDPGRNRRGTNMRTYLLTGILHCAKPKEDHRPCGWGLIGRPRSGVPRYVCPNTPGTDSCAGTATNTAKTDEFIVSMALTALDSPDFQSRLTSNSSDDYQLLFSELKADEEELEQLARDFGARRISRGEWMAARAPFEERAEANRARLAKVSASTPLTDFVGTYEDMTSRWEGLNVSQRRAVLGAVIRRVDVLPAKKKWDPDRFVIDWRA